ncbi:MAG: ASCH domain-containing protein [Desulfurococcales archaeon]|nr:ASCH domain-containing protein [Desulfurococcales archaeon]
MGRRQFLGRHLMLKREYGNMLLEGRKRATIRLGVVTPKYEELIVHSGGRPIAKVRVVGVEVKRVRELTDDDARLDGFESLDELLEALRRAYGDVSPEDYVTILRLEVVQRLDSLESDDPYLGLEPADIARLALRYLKGEMSREEERIFRSLTATNSIRMTAQRLYGSPLNRARVRRALRRALRELQRRGLIGAG